jgi:hypothetical protein
MMFDFISQQLNGSLTLSEQAGHKIHQCCFAGTVGTEQAKSFTGGNLQV